MLYTYALLERTGLRSHMTESGTGLCRCMSVCEDEINGGARRGGNALKGGQGYNNNNNNKIQLG